MPDIQEKVVICVDEAPIKSLMSALDSLNLKFTNGLPSGVSEGMSKVESVIKKTGTVFEGLKNPIQSVIAELGKLKTSTTSNSEKEVEDINKVSKAYDEQASHAKKAGEESSKPKKEKGGGGGIGEIIGIGAALEGLNMLTEKSKEVADAQKAMKTVFGSNYEAMAKQADEAGAKLGQTGDEYGKTMAQVASTSHLTGQKLIDATNAVVAARQAGIPISAKSLSTEKGLQTVIAEGGPLVANAMKAAQDPAQQAQLAMAKMQETVGKLANVLLTALGPVLTAVMPLIDQIGSLVASVIKPAMDALAPSLATIVKTFSSMIPVLSGMLVPVIKLLADGLNALQPILPALVIGIIAVTGAMAAMDLVMMANPVVLIGLAIVALIGGLVELYDNVKPIRDIFQELWDVMKAGWAFIETYVMTYIQHLVAAFEDLGKVLNDLIHLNFSGAIKDATDAFGQIASASVDAAQKAGKAAGASMNDSANQELTDKYKATTQQYIDNVTKALANSANDPKRKAYLEAQLAEYKAYGTKLGMSFADGVADGGATVTPPSTPKKTGGKGKGKSKEELAKAEADRFLAVQKDADLNLDENDATHKAKELALAETRAETLLTIAKKYNKANSKEVADADIALIAAKKAVNENLTTIQKAWDDENKSNQDDIDAKNIAVQQTIATANVEHLKSQFALTLAIMKINGDDTIEFERDEALKEQKINYDNLVQKAKDDGTYYAMKATLVQQNADAIAKINQDADQKDTTSVITGLKKIQDEQLKTAQLFAGPLSKGVETGFAMMTKPLDQFTEKLTQSKTVAGQVFGTITSSFIKMGEDMLKKLIETEAMQLAQKAIFGAAAIADATAQGTAIAAAMGPAAAMASIASFGAADVAGGTGLASVLALAQAAAIPHADGGITTQPLMAGNHLFGESGSEAILPLQNSKYPGLHAMATGDGNKEMLSVLKQIHQSTSSPHNVMQVDQYKTYTTVNKSRQQNNQRKA